MSSNEKLIQKADFTVGDLASGGLLNAEQSNSFQRKLLVFPTILNDVRRVPMSSPVRNVNKISFASTILRAAVSATPLSQANRSKPTTEQIVLTTKEVIAEVRLPYDAIEDNIEGGNIGTHVGGAGDMTGGLKDTVMTLIAQRTAIDLEKVLLLGDTADPDALLAQQDGYLKLISAHTVNAAGQNVSRKIFTDGMKALPSQYRANRVQLRHYVSTEAEIDYRETVAARETAVGDSQTRQTDPLFAAGAPVGGVGQMPATQGILVNPQNLLFGIQRDVHIETDKIIQDRVYVIVLTMRIAIKVEETDAAVKYINLG